LGARNLALLMSDEITRGVKSKTPQEEYDALMKMWNDMEWKPLTSGNLKKLEAIKQNIEHLLNKYKNEITPRPLKNLRTK
jgi:hypothetical protein